MSESSIVYSQALRAQLDVMAFAESPSAQDWIRRAERSVKPEGVSPEAGREFRIAMDAVKNADPYYWSPEMCDLLTQTAPSLPTCTLSDDLLPNAPYPYSGFFWFARPLPLPNSAPGDGDIVAISWHSIVAFGPGDDVGKTMCTPLFWVNWPHHPGFLPVTIFRWFEDETTDDIIAKQDGGARFEAKVRYFAAALTLLQQRLLVAEGRPAHRSVQRRLRGTTKDAPLIKVVHLRRMTRGASPSEESGPPDWSCQWIVRGHWRQQYYRSKNEHRPRWIAPYVKGPEDKPLKTPRATVFAVVR